MTRKKTAPARKVKTRVRSRGEKKQIYGNFAALDTSRAMPNSPGEEIQGQNDLLKNAIEALSHPFYVIDANDYTIVMANSASGFGKLDKKSTCYALTRKKNEPCGGEGYPCPLDIIKKTKKPTIVEHAHFDRDGNARIYEISCHPILDKNGNVTRVIESSIDITERKKVQEELMKLRLGIERSGEAIFLTDTAGRINYVNPAFEKLYGFSSEEAIGKTPRILKSGTLSHDVYEKFWKALLTKQVMAGEIINKTKDGQLLTAEYSANPILDDKGNIIGFLAIQRDITQRKRAEDMLRESMQALGDRVKELNCFYETSRLISDINMSWDVILQKVVDLIPPSWQYPEITCARINLEGRQFRTDKFVVTPWKQSADIRILGEKKGSIDVHYLQEKPTADEGPFLKEERDLINAMAREMGRFIERKRAEEALRESERRYKELFDSVIEGIGLVDENEIIQFCNPAFAHIFDVDSVTELQGKSLLDFIPEDQREFTLWQTGKHRRRQNSQYELEIITAKRSRKTVLASFAPGFDDENNYIGAFGAIMDITEKKKLQESASRAQRLETAGRVAGQVAHDFNNLLGPLTAYPELIKGKLPAGHSVLKYVDAIERSAKQMAEISQELLTLGRRAHYKVEPLNLGDIVRQAIDQIQPIPETLVIDIDTSPDLMNVMGGASQISRVILNLVTNARDAMLDTGHLIIKVENFYLDKPIAKFEQIPTGEYVKLTISDTGAGIPEEIIAKIFDPFFSTKNVDKMKGSGLGLSVVHAVVEDHNGYIDVESVVGRGTSFFIYFPIARENLNMSLDEHIVGGTESILIVDDDRVQMDIALTLVKKLGYDVSSVKSGKEAIDRIRKNPQDLLILDMIMPDGIDGVETYKRALAIDPSQKAIMVSGYTDANKIEEAKKLGIGTFIGKPLTLKSLAIALRKELDKKAAETVKEGEAVI